ncbi:MAG: glycosyl hydrolase [Phycisphaerae bacterium]
MASARGPFELWSDPPSIYRSAPFWSWNSKLEADRLCRAIEEMHKAGMGGFFMHSRYGLKTPYLGEEWFKCVAACIEKARQLDMKAYLYDEDRWPSGAAGGLVTRPHKEFRCQRLIAAAAGEPDPEAERIGVFSVKRDEQGSLLSYQAVESHEAGGEVIAFDAKPTETSGWHNDGAYLDTMNPQAVAEFIRVTHQAYADRFQNYFGKIVPAIFTDEPNYGDGATFFQEGKPVKYYLQWTPALPREFRTRRGYDLRDKLPELILPLAGGEFSKVRHDYRRTLTELFVEAFARQIGQWCEKHNIALTGHWLCEESLALQCRLIGAAMPHYEHEQWPGIDILTDSVRELITAKQCSSVADQLGRERVLSELYGCTGWDWPLEGHKFIGDWQFASGVNFRCPHLTHYSLAGGAKRDYPASIFKHSPWWKHYGIVEDYFGRLSYMLTQGKAVRDVLVIHPIESAWGVYINKGRDWRDALPDLQDPLDRIINALSSQHYDWDFGDESLLARHASVTKAAIKVGKMSYKLIIVPPTITLRATTVALLKKFLAGGGKVLFIGRQPSLVDATPSKDLPGLVAKAATCGDQVDQFVPAIEGLLARRVSISEGSKELTCTWSMLRAVKVGGAGKTAGAKAAQAGQLLFIQSHDRKGEHTARVSVEGRGPVVLWDARSGQTTLVPSQEAAKRVEFYLALPPTGSALVSLGLTIRGAAEPASPPKVVQTQTLSGPFDIELAESATLPLDYCSFRIGDEPFSQPVPSLKADAEIRKRFGLGTRLGGEHQPWYLYAMGTVDTKPRARCQIRRTFHVTDLPKRCALAIESPQDFQITINGKPAGKAEGFWVDDDIRTIDITSLLQSGQNEVMLTFDYRPDMELEDLYLVGEFGVTRGALSPVTEGKDSVVRGHEGISLVAPPRQLAIGSWVGQGLDFYGGAVKYHVKVSSPPAGKRVRISLPGVACTCAVIHAGGKSFALPWPPFAADITDALESGVNDVTIEVIGGRKNILGPLHVPWEGWTGPGQFNPDNEKWRREYLLVDHGLMQPVVVETLE